MDRRAAPTAKRLILCLDGTWMDSDKGYQKKSPFSKSTTIQVPSNVTRISRCFKRRCANGMLQIVNYESGVGTGSTLDSITGGLFGSGLAEVSESRCLLIHPSMVAERCSMPFCRGRENRIG